MNIKEIELKAQEVLVKCGISSVPIPVEDIADKYGVQVSRAPSKEFSGILIRKENRSLMGINSTESSVRQRFTIAHELGHLLLHSYTSSHIDRKSPSPIQLRDEVSSLATDEDEIESNAFAAELLMPDFMLEKDLQEITAEEDFNEKSIKDLAEKYNVSEQAMTYRLINLGYVRY